MASWKTFWQKSQSRFSTNTAVCGYCRPAWRRIQLRASGLQLSMQRSNSLLFQTNSSILTRYRQQSRWVCNREVQFPPVPAYGCDVVLRTSGFGSGEALCCKTHLAQIDNLKCQYDNTGRSKSQMKRQPQREKRRITLTLGIIIVMVSDVCTQES